MGLTASACSSSTDLATEETATEETETGQPETGEPETEETADLEPDDPAVLYPDAPPPYTFIDTGEPLVLNAFTSCWNPSGICSDGEPPTPLPNAGLAGDQITFNFPIDGWNFLVRIGEDPNAVTAEQPVEALGDGVYVIGPIVDPPGSVIEIFGRGPQGDAIATFTVEWDLAEG